MGNRAEGQVMSSKGKAFGYVRISDDKSGRGAGVERQRVDIKALAQRLGIELVEVFEDNDRSATKGTRPEYVRMFKRVAHGDCDVVLAYSQDRLWRDDLEHPVFMRMAREANVRLHLVHGGEVKPDDAHDAFVSTIINAVAVMEAANTRRRVKRELSDKRAAGKYLGGPRSFGHTASRDAEVKDEAKLIRDAARRLLRGESQASIVRDWHKRGVKTPRGGYFIVATLGQLMRQPRLAALHEVDGELREAQWPAILDRETWGHVQAVLTSHRKRPVARKHLLAGGYLRCELCGTTLRSGHVTVRADGNLIRYICPSPMTTGKGCGKVSIDGPRAEAEVVDRVLTHLDSPEFARAMKRAMKEVGKGDAAEVVKQLERKRAKRLEVEVLFEADDIEPAEYKRMRARVLADIAELEAKLSTIAELPPVHLAGQGKALRKDWDAMTFEEQRDVLALVLDHCDVRKMKSANRWRPDRIAPPVWRY
jgi:site-specific DNA recombinase